MCRVEGQGGGKAAKHLKDQHLSKDQKHHKIQSSFFFLFPKEEMFPFFPTFDVFDLSVIIEAAAAARKTVDLSGLRVSIFPLGLNFHF